MTFLAEEDVLNLGELELSGLIEPDDDSHVPDIDIEDYMITYYRLPYVSVEGGGIAAGGNFLTALFEALVIFGKTSRGGAAATKPTIPASKAARLFGVEGKSKGAGSATQRFAALRKKDSDINKSKAPAGAKEAASKSDAATNILKSKTFQECLAIGAGAALASAATKRQENSNNTKLIWGRTIWPSISTPPKRTTIRHPMTATNKFILLPNRASGDRLYYGACGRVPQDNEITLLQTWNGCCKYFNGENCESENALFKQTDREDGQLKGNHNDVVSSYWCNFDWNCTGAPGG
ncbi:hypothetical protein BCR34DRAFT_203332 [Clohesyomyces aquaticus]|uniref:Uncharacterized protein n=1 Tax=Clohesyomyces aquaticus TaxID=1231657 RepID=A0A1Y1ZXN1_9PLEO|nr:hypothetical protein BCR34DRAFT_203332 [Clohesyomyces aquaticus]